MSDFLDADALLISSTHKHRKAHLISPRGWTTIVIFASFAFAVILALGS